MFVEVKEVLTCDKETLFSVKRLKSYVQHIHILNALHIHIGLNKILSIYTKPMESFLIYSGRSLLDVSRSVGIYSRIGYQAFPPRPTVCTHGGLDHQDDEQQMMIDDVSVLQQARQVQFFDPPVVFSGTRPFRSPSCK